ncbi:hypothetical protein GQ53DRAFT_788904 [Thozetella sp. PMI_491]|nr:hypothetical protein GQ53DRAFT_788904 [Thozetella sp. PMI_491]
MHMRTIQSAVLACTTLQLADAAVIARAKSSVETCAGSSFNENGNWFCKAVGQITYSHFAGSAGHYDQVVGMDTSTGQCSFGQKDYSGPLAPFNEPMSLHFRGPIRLKQLAVYMPKGSTKREEAQVEADVAPRVSEMPVADPELLRNKKRDHPTIWVTATINGQVVSWINDYWGPEVTPSPAPAKPSPSVQKAPAQATSAPCPEPTAASGNGGGAGGTTGTTGTTGTAGTAGTGDHVRVAYYNAPSQQSSGLMFLGNYGGTQGSGRWTSAFGNTLSYINAQGTDGAASSTTLADTTVPSGHEFSVFMDQPCDDSCGFIQPGSVAYKGFGGADKAFLFEFSMPHESGATGAQADMPALWMLNARIPYTGQYSPCSCWKSGCGEFDIFEVLAPGDNKCKSTLHSVYNGGDSNYFSRPVDGTIKLAVVFDSASATVSAKVLDSATQFGDHLTAANLASLMGDGGLDGMGSSFFQLG